MGVHWKRREVIGDCTLYLGDCLEVLPRLDPVDAVVTDPPYGVGLTAKVTKHGRIEASSTYSDDPAEVLPLVTRALELAQFSRAVVTSGTRLAQSYPKADSIGAIYAPNGAGMDRWGFGCFHPILYYGKCPYTSAGMGGRPNSFTATAGLQVTGENAVDHPCPKPISWMLWLVRRGSLDGETVLDPFMGSGTTGVACVRLGRKFIDIEIDEHYFDIACERIDAEYRQGNLFREAVPQFEQESLLETA